MKRTGTLTVSALLLLVTTLFTLQGRGQATDSIPVYPSSLTLEFDSLPDFTLIFDPWITEDLGGGFTYTITGISFPHSTEPMAFINFNPAATSPPETYMKPYTGKKLGCCFASTPPYNPNNKWLISPKMHLANSPKIEFWVQTYNIAYGLERFNVAVSTTDNDPAHFEKINTITETAPAVWTRFTYLPEKYANQEVYIGIQCISDNTFILMLDDLSITSVVGLNEETAGSGFSVYPNPASGVCYLRFAQESQEDVTAELVNSLGATVRTLQIRSGGERVPVDINGLPDGIYSLRVSGKSGAWVRKICVTD